jgi:uncharacterized damage-inducible protein DinB
MFDRDEALHLLEYDAWASRRVEAALRAAPGVSPDAVKLFGHVAASLATWMVRIQGGVATPKDWWPPWSVDESSRRLAAAVSKWQEYAARLDAKELAREVRFTNSLGVDCHDPVEAIVRHVVNHGTHHRAQIASLLRAAGHAPPNADYIAWRRETERAGSAR